MAALGAGARPVAGGTDLVVGSRQGKAPLPEAIVAIDRIEALRELRAIDGGLHLGALTTHGAIVASADVSERFTALADASAIVGSHATRANGTIGGNVMNASPAMDTGGPLLCFDARVSLRSAEGERTVAIGELWTGPGRRPTLHRASCSLRSTCPNRRRARVRRTFAWSTVARWRSRWSAPRR